MNRFSGLDRVGRFDPLACCTLYWVGRGLTGLDRVAVNKERESRE